MTMSMLFDIIYIYTTYIYKNFRKMVIHLFGDRLRELRKEKKIRQEEIGTLCGVAKNTVSNWENNITQPPFETVTTLAKYFNVTTDYLLGFNQDDLDKIDKLKIACQEAGISIAGQDFTVEDFERAMQVVEMLKEKK